MEKTSVKRSIIINATAAEVWKALTDPQLIKQYFFGMDVKSEWKHGCPILFSGTWKGKEYEDKGKITRIEPNKLLEHTYWSSLSGLPDEPDNYQLTTYEIDEREKDIVLCVTQVGAMSEGHAKQCAENWETVLQKLKDLLEKHPELEA